MTINPQAATRELSVTGPPENPSNSSEIRALLLAAFEQARQSGKSDWQEMTTAVLKNRLLSLTDFRFDLRAYGVDGVADFAALAPDTVEVDRDRPYPVVRLRGYLSGSTPETHPIRSTGSRLRSDLWQAIFDYSRDEGYVWDGVRKIALPRTTEVDGPSLPTLTGTEFDEWREAFVKLHETQVHGASLDQLQTWATNRLPTRLLPRALQPLWYEELKNKAVARLREWFAANGIPEPADLLGTRALAASSHFSTEIEALRQVVQASVARMTADELRSLQLPASAVARIVRSRPRSGA